MTSQTFTEEEFWKAFPCDIRQARGRILVQSPFVASRRIKLLAKEMCALIGKGITICVFVQEPRNWLSDRDGLDPQVLYNLQEFGLAVQMLRSWGIHVNLRKDIHAKLAVVDDEILWEGSLNILSHANSKEHMRRWKSEAETRAAVTKHALSTCAECEANYRRYGVAVRRLQRFAEVGPLLATQRARKQLSQRALAKISGVPHNRISQIEAGRNMKLDTLVRIMDALGLKILVVPELFTASVMRFLRQLEASGSP